MFNLHVATMAVCGLSVIANGCAQAVRPETGGAPDAQPGEQRDAGNTVIADAPPDGPPPIGYACFQATSYPDTDGCSSAYDLSSAAVMPAGARVYGDTTGYSDDFEPDSSDTGGFTLDGPDAVYRVQATAGQRIDVTLTTDAASFDASVYLIDACSSSATFLAGSSSFTGPGTESVAYIAPTTAAYYIVVDSYHQTEYGCYTLAVTVQ